MRHFIRMYFGYFGQYVKGQMAYRANFWVEGASYVFWIATEIALLYLVLLPVEALAGWNLPEVLLMYGISLAGFGLFFMFGVNLFYLPGRYIIEGNLDRVLLRPMDPYFQLLMENFSAEDCITFITGSCIVGYALIQLGFPLSIVIVLQALLVIIGAGLVYGGLLTIAGSLSFWLKDRTGVMELVLETTDKLSHYPLSIYPRIMRIVLTILIPVGFCGFYPAQTFLATDSLKLMGWLSPLVGLLTFGAGYGVWRLGLRGYESAGS